MSIQESLNSITSAVGGAVVKTKALQQQKQSNEIASARNAQNEARMLAKDRFDADKRKLALEKLSYQTETAKTILEERKAKKDIALARAKKMDISKISNPKNVNPKKKEVKK